MGKKLVIFEEEKAICYILDKRKAKKAISEMLQQLPDWAMEKQEVKLIISEAKVINFLPLIENKPYILQYYLEEGDVKEQAVDQYRTEIYNMLRIVIQKVAEKESKIPRCVTVHWDINKKMGEKSVERRDLKEILEQIAQQNPLDNYPVKQILSVSPYIQEMGIYWNDNVEENVGISYENPLEDEVRWLKVSRLHFHLWDELKKMCNM